MGCLLSWSENTGTFDFIKLPEPYQYTEVKGSKMCNIDLTHFHPTVNTADKEKDNRRSPPVVFLQEKV